VEFASRVVACAGHRMHADALLALMVGLKKPSSQAIRRPAVHQKPCGGEYRSIGLWISGPASPADARVAGSVYFALNNTQTSNTAGV
jgi:hypothetical protein